MSDQPVFPMGVEQIQEYIPHRYPLLLLDRVTEFEPEVGIVAQKNVSASDIILQGHFPGNPIMPGVLQVEALAQASAVYGRLMRPNSTSVLLAEVSSARFRRMVVPGDTMTLDVKVDKCRKNFFWFKGEVRVGDEVAAITNFSAMLD